MQEVFRQRLDRPLAAPFVAFGGDVKCALAAGTGRDVVVYEAVGDLADPENQDALEREAPRLIERAQGTPILVCDKHPGYFSRKLCRRLADEGGLNVVEVQHHRAHIAAVAAEFNLTDRPIVGLAFDGTGYGDDGVIWGGEFFAGSAETGLSRQGSFAPLSLCGGDAAVREPWRIALAFLIESGVPDEHVRAWLELIGRPGDSLPAFAAALRQGLNCVRTTALGRWFDCFAVLWNVRTKIDFEAQAAMDLQRAAESASDGCFLGPASVRWMGDALAVIQFDPFLDTVEYMLADWSRQHQALWAKQFHASVADAVAIVTERLAAAQGTEIVCCGGGCFLNSLLCAMLDDRFARLGLRRVQPKALPPGDPAIGLGQIVLADRLARA